MVLDMMQSIKDQIAELKTAGNGVSMGRPGAEDFMDEDGEDEEAAAPFRGSFGECPPIEERFAFLDDKTLKLALSGHLGPEKLPLLIPPTADIYNGTDDGDQYIAVMDPVTRQFFAAPPKNSTAKVVEKFLDAIPDVTVFLYAWGNLMDIMMHGSGEPEAACQIFSALNNHAQWMVDNSVHFTWESIVRYHLTVAGKRFAKEFHTSDWYDAFDGQAGTRLVRKPPRQFPVHNTKSTTPAGPAKKGRSHPPPANDSQAVCIRFNTGQCKGKSCPNGRKHVCLLCDKAGHTNAECEKVKSKDKGKTGV